MRRKNLALRVLSTATFLAMVASCTAPAFADTYYLGDYQDGLLIEAREDGKVYVNNKEDQDSNVVIMGGSSQKSTAEDNIAANSSEQQVLTSEQTEAASPVAAKEEPGDNTVNVPENQPVDEQKEDGKEADEAEQTGDTENQPEEKPEDGTKPEEQGTEEKQGPAEEDDTPSEDQQEEPEAQPEEEDKETSGQEEQKQETVQPRASLNEARTLQSKDDAPAVTAQADDSQNNNTVDSALKSVIKIINNWKDKILDVTLNGVNIDKSKTGTSAADPAKYGEAAMAVTGSGDTTIHLKGSNTLKSGTARAGLEKNDSESAGKLTITADSTEDSLTAVGGDRAAGIGGGQWESASKIVVAGGKIDATGGNTGAGIGGGRGGDGEVTITGGDVNAYGGSYAFGIGSGSNNSRVTPNIKTVGEVTITGGTVVSKNRSGANGNAIGGNDEEKSKVSLSGGEVTAIGKISEIEVDGSGTIIKANSIPKDHVHSWKEISHKDAGIDQLGETVSECTCGATQTVYTPVAGHNWDAGVVTTQPTTTTEGVLTYTCTGCGATRTESIPMLKPEVPDNSEIEAEADTGNVVAASAYEPLTVVDCASEQMLEGDRLVIAVPAESATLRGSLGALKAYQAKGAKVLVFRTQQKESVVSIEELLNSGSEKDIFVLTHNGNTASLTVAGRDANALLK